MYYSRIYTTVCAFLCYYLRTRYVHTHAYPDLLVDSYGSELASVILVEAAPAAAPPLKQHSASLVGAAHDIMSAR